MKKNKPIQTKRIKIDKYPLKQSKPNRTCWIEMRKEDGGWYKEQMWFTFESVVKNIKRYERMRKQSPQKDWLKPYNEKYEVFECEVVKRKKIVFE